MTSAQFYKNHATRALQTCLQAPITPSEKHLKRNQKVLGWPWVLGAALEPCGFSLGVPQRELQEVEREIAEISEN
jgi:hypothetical protein